MAIEMPGWCGACDPDTRRFNLGDLEKRCAQCNPYWDFGHSSIDPAVVPVTQGEQRQAVRWLLYEIVGLRTLPATELQRRTKAFFDSGWTPHDVVVALDFDPDGSPVRIAKSAADSPELTQRRVLNLLSSWCDERGRPLASPSQVAAARQRRLRERQRVTRAKLAELASRQSTPHAATLSGARQIAAEALVKARQMKLEGRKRENAARAVEMAAQEAQETRMQQTLRQLDKFKFGILSGAGEGGLPAGGRVTEGIAAQSAPTDGATLTATPPTGPAAGKAKKARPRKAA
jgi:hypothetical protein